LRAETLIEAIQSESFGISPCGNTRSETAKYLLECKGKFGSLLETVSNDCPR